MHFLYRVSTTALFPLHKESSKEIDKKNVLFINLEHFV